MGSLRLRFFLVFMLICCWTASATRVCHYCNGINCQRTNYDKTEVCQDDMDVCVTIFGGPMVEAQGCYQHLGEELRQKCTKSDEDATGKGPMPQCQKCLSNLCNDMGPMGYECIQCDSEKDEVCRTDPATIKPTQCPMPRSNNPYCFVTDDGSRTVRGCAGMVEDQKNCMSQNTCYLCSPMDIHACNLANVPEDDGNGNGSGGDGGNGGDGGGNGGNGTDTGGNNKSPIASVNYTTLVICLSALVIKKLKLYNM